MKNYIEQIIKEIHYDDLSDAWKLSHDKLKLIRKSFHEGDKDKILFDYNQQAVKNISKLLYEYYHDNNDPKKRIFDKCNNHGMERDFFHEYKNIKHRLNPDFFFYEEHFKTDDENKYIHGKNFFNRACFWMATGSGKSIVLIKTIELLDYLYSKKSIPKKDIMLLIPRDDLIKQFKGEVDDFNIGRERKIELISLKDYDENQSSFDFSIKVYYYRSDLIRAEKKETILDYKTYENNGNWHVFLDEAHRGDKDDSLLQKYVTILSKNGFLFNFSATFTDPIDYATTCYNFNLEKFITAGYGKNIYVSNSYFNFTKQKDDLSRKDKQKQVLKSLIIFSLIKKQKKNNEYYHHPLLMTLVNSVNTEDSDLLMFFKQLEDIASMNVDNDFFEDIKKEISEELTNHRDYFFGNEKLKFDIKEIEKITLKDLLVNVFNSEDRGKIEIIEGESGKEIALKLQTSSNIFALIKIGDTKKFQKERLGNNYLVIQNPVKKKYFEEINKNKNINLLLGSRSFYEGWNSNRPNVVNLINIGKKDAKKFVLQAIGRGVRIEPCEGERQRIKRNSNIYKHKNVLLESLFIFATDKNAIKAIIQTMNEQKANDESLISLSKQKEIIELLVPKFIEDNSNLVYETSKFYISENSLEKLRKYVSFFKMNVFLLNTSLNLDELSSIVKKINDDSFFQIDDSYNYKNMEELLNSIISHFRIRYKKIKGIDQIEDEINHYKAIKISLSDKDRYKLEELIQEVSNYKHMNEEQIRIKKESIKNDLDNEKITIEKLVELYKQLDKNKKKSNKAEFQDFIIQNLYQHYYSPVIYSENDRNNNIKNIIDVKSEREFLKNLIEEIEKSENSVFEGKEWMFSKISEQQDNLFIPYFSKSDNKYRKFFPDFIFWIKEKNQYKIVFIDPKGSEYSDYQNKVDEFKKLFYGKDDKPIIFNYKNLKVSCDLKLITDDINNISSDYYRKFWMHNKDFKEIFKV